jgi:LysR family transcriptional regulator, transcription activator of glutamate synthase operon
MDLRQLRFVEAVARHSSFTHAAAELHVAQPALSLGIRNLETEIGVRLFARTSRRVVITDAGQAFLDGARTILGEVDALSFEMAEYAGAVRGRVRLGSSYHLEPRIPDLLRIFRAENPIVDFSIVERTTPQMLDGVRDGQLDVALPVITPEIDLTDIRYELVREEPLVMVVARNDPIAALESVGLATIATRPFICSGPGTAPRHWLDQVLANSGVQVPVAFETTGVGAMIEYASIGLGATILTRSLVEASRRDVSIVPITDGPLFRLGLAWHARGYSGAATDGFIQLARRMLVIGNGVEPSSAPIDVIGDTRPAG